MRLKISKKNGFIFYITCSLLKIENEEVIENFLMDNKHFRLLNKKNITIDDSGDGFFCAVLQRKIKVDIKFFYDSLLRTKWEHLNK